MPKIKSYKNVDRYAEDVSFNIKKMQEIYEVTQGKVDDPHRHDFYTVILLEDGKGSHTIDFHSFDLGQKQVYFISPGQVHQLIEEQMSKGYVMTFSPEFLMQNGIEKRFINDLHVFLLNGYSPPLILTEDLYNDLNSFCERMSKEIIQKTKYSYLSVGSWLKLFLIKCQQACISPAHLEHEIESSGNLLLRNFQSLLEANHKKWHKVQDYSEQLHITSDHLNTSISQSTGQNVKAHIQNRIILAAKRELLFSGRTTKEIGFDLGFIEASHFSQFFKKCVGISPSEYIKSN